MNPIGFLSCYDECERCAEALFFDYRRQHDLDIKMVLIFNIYWPRMHANGGRVVSNFIVQTLRCEDSTLYGDGLIRLDGFNETMAGCGHQATESWPCTISTRGRGDAMCVSVHWRRTYSSRHASLSLTTPATERSRIRERVGRFAAIKA